MFALCLLASSLAAAQAPTQTIRGKVRLLRDGAPVDATGLVVYLEGLEAPAEPVTGKKVAQQDLKFSPQMTVVTVGSTIEFPNLDRVFHNVFSLSRAARFDLGIYKDGESKSVTFKRAGTIDLFCNIHPQMVAKILVVPTKFHVTTGADGAFSFQGVPKGPVTVVAWQPHGEPGKVELTEGHEGELVIDVTATDAAVRHLKKDGTPYGRYR